MMWKNRDMKQMLPSLLQSIHYTYSCTLLCLSMNCFAFIESSPLHTLKSVDKVGSPKQLGIPAFL